MDRSGLLWLLVGAGVLWWLSQRSGGSSQRLRSIDEIVASNMEPGYDEVRAIFRQTYGRNPTDIETNMAFAEISAHRQAAAQQFYQSAGSEFGPPEFAG